MNAQGWVGVTSSPVPGGDLESSDPAPTRADRRPTMKSIPAARLEARLPAARMLRAPSGRRQRLAMSAWFDICPVDDRPAMSGWPPWLTGRATLVSDREPAHPPVGRSELGPGVILGFWMSGGLGRRC
jgi:hypothetical protein